MNLPPNLLSDHPFLLFVAWGVLIDIGVLAIGALRGKKLPVDTRIIHSLFMWSTFFLSAYGTYLMAVKNWDGRSKSLLRGDLYRDLHFGLGVTTNLLSIGSLAGGVLTFSGAKIPNLPAMHRLFGTIVWLLAKVNIIVACFFYQKGVWLVAGTAWVVGSVVLSLVLRSGKSNKAKVQ